ncbi:hypothetical protein TNCV_1099361 [Trichonephila clavipes]|nr:hypothetical protein TNCV_1099361 [Trichonephila clavipes]
MNHIFKKPLVTEFDCPRIITSTIARLRTEHLKDRKIHPDKTRSYVQCKHCPDLQLTPNHILECPTVATKLLKMGMVPLRDSLRELLPRVAEQCDVNIQSINQSSGNSCTALMLPELQRQSDQRI